MNRFSYEIDLFSPVISYFYNQGCIIQREIQIGFCRADIVAFTPNKQVISVELKLSDWKKAIIQAKNYQLASDYVYIAFPLKKINLVLKKAEHILTKEGIGLLGIDEQTKKVRICIKAGQSMKKLGTLSLYEIQKNQTKKKRRRRPGML